MPDRRYERDLLAWGEHQAALLRRVAQGETMPEGLDWPHVIAEIEQAGLADLRACLSLLVQAMAHLLRLHLRPEAAPAAYWRAETAAFLAGARRGASPALRGRIDLDALWLDAVYEIRAEMDEYMPPTLPDDCPFTLDQLLALHPEPGRLLRILSGSGASG
ncbi:MAG TPA: DUF29 family protein [Acidisoma sp.]|nr:DUF29 family protein [Acidisoma sp.]